LSTSRLACERGAESFRSCCWPWWSPSRSRCDVGKGSRAVGRRCRRDDATSARTTVRGVSSTGAADPCGSSPRRVHLEFVMAVGRLPSGGDVKAPVEGSGPTFRKRSSRGTPPRPKSDFGFVSWFPMWVSPLCRAVSPREWRCSPLRGAVGRARGSVS